MKAFWACLLILAATLAQPQLDGKTAPPTLKVLGLACPLSTDWILATTLMRKYAAAQNTSSDSVILAAVYVPPKKNTVISEPFLPVKVSTRIQVNYQLAY